MGVILMKQTKLKSTSFQEIVRNENNVPQQVNLSETISNKLSE
jgi:hypothetical protein